MRISAQRYNDLDQYARLADALTEILGAPITAREVYHSGSDGDAEDVDEGVGETAVLVKVVVALSRDTHEEVVSVPLHRRAETPA